jgi:hypothetical protein
MKLTRRQLVATLAPAAALAQNPATPAASPATPADELKAAQSRLKANSDALNKIAVPMDTEPAFQFHA